ncbi:hypothetical protein WICPIJ_009242 [Wickerhamomyces pijperi]|uniref:Uncharacterized protein n=1 Tax=Wickerhamomyces pijperi TaxID=599730 RepID=A0A9P8PQR1_WICPI|nr:hypothetical protein WICPIJ_009242 [Wickerhamomyces pijperi]
MPTKISMELSLTSKDGKWGKKSLPQKKHMKTQSSMARSRSNLKFKFGTFSSTSKYSRRTLMFNQRNGFLYSCKCCFLSSDMFIWLLTDSCLWSWANTSSLRTLKCGSCVASPKKIKSASNP